MFIREFRQVGETDKIGPGRSELFDQIARSNDAKVAVFQETSARTMRRRLEDVLRRIRYPGQGAGRRKRGERGVDPREGVQDSIERKRLSASDLTPAAVLCLVKCIPIGNSVHRSKVDPL
jgi:hypothetical protein